MDGLGDRPGPAASPASPKRSAPGSSPWSPKTRRASSSPSPAAASKPKTRRGRLLDFGHARRGRTRDGHRSRAQPGKAHPALRRRALAQHPAVGREPGPGVRPKRSKIAGLYTNPPPGSTVVCVDELGPVTPRFFPPAPG
jgi:hypothetical protein